MPKIPTWALVAATTVAVVGSGVAVAEVTSGSGAEVAEEPTTTLPTEPVPTTLPGDEDPTDEDPTGEDPVDESDEAAGGTERYWGPECGEDPTNHGGYVARAERNGESRSEAAQSPCGKPLASVHTTTTTAPPEEPAVDETPDATQTSPGSPGNGRGNGGGNGKGNAGGNGKGRGR